MQMFWRLIWSFVGCLNRLDRTLQDLVYKLVPGLLSRKCRLPESEYLIYFFFLGGYYAVLAACRFSLRGINVVVY